MRRDQNSTYSGFARCDTPTQKYSQPTFCFSKITEISFCTISLPLPMKMITHTTRHSAHQSTLQITISFNTAGDPYFFLTLKTPSIRMECWSWIPRVYIMHIHPSLRSVLTFQRPAMMAVDDATHLSSWEAGVRRQDGYNLGYFRA